MLDLAYDELPAEMLDYPTLELSSWSLIISDSCLSRLASLSQERQEQHIPNQVSELLLSGDPVGSSSIGHSVALLSKPSRVNASNHGLIRLNVHGAEQITDRGVKTVYDSCSKLEELNIGKAEKVRVARM